jgi:hypothetical protein
LTKIALPFVGSKLSSIGEFQTNRLAVRRAFVVDQSAKDVIDRRRG